MGLFAYIACNTRVSIDEPGASHVGILLINSQIDAESKLLIELALIREKKARKSGTNASDLEPPGMVQWLIIKGHPAASLLFGVWRGDRSHIERIPWPFGMQIGFSFSFNFFKEFSPTLREAFLLLVVHCVCPALVTGRGRASLLQPPGPPAIAKSGGPLSPRTAASIRNPGMSIGIEVPGASEGQNY